MGVEVVGLELGPGVPLAGPGAHARGCSGRVVLGGELGLGVEGLGLELGSGVVLGGELGLAELRL